MKSLNITIKNCTLVPNSYGVTINKDDLQDIVRDKLPKDLKNYEGYHANVHVSIEIMDSETVVETEGYFLEEEIPEEYEKEVPAEVTEDGGVDVYAGE